MRRKPENRGTRKKGSRGRKKYIASKKISADSDGDAVFSECLCLEKLMNAVYREIAGERRTQV